MTANSIRVRRPLAGGDMFEKELSHRSNAKPGLHKDSIMNKLLSILAIALMVSCWSGTTQAQCSNGYGYSRPVSRSYYGGGYRGVPVRSSSFYRGSSFGYGGFNRGFNSFGRSFYGGSGFNRGFGGFGGYGGRGISIRF